MSFRWSVVVMVLMILNILLVDVTFILFAPEFEISPQGWWMGALAGFLYIWVSLLYVIFYFEKDLEELEDKEDFENKYFKILRVLQCLVPLWVFVNAASYFSKTEPAPNYTKPKPYPRYKKITKQILLALFGTLFMLTFIISQVIIFEVPKDETNLLNNIDFMPSLWIVVASVAFVMIVSAIRVAVYFSKNKSEVDEEKGPQ